MASLKDVAERVGVSITTVSRVLNNRGSISQATRDRVFQAMKELDYHPNEMARSLVQKNSHLIGLIVPYIAHPFFSELTEVIQEACYASGYKLLLCVSNSQPEKEKELFSMLRSNNAAGVLVCSRIEESDVYLNGGIPIVSIERELENIPSVSCDNYKGGVLAARELLRSSRHPLLFGNRVQEYLPAYLRYKGFFDECRRQGVSYNAYYLDAEELYGDSIAEHLRRVAEKFPDVDGIFATSDILAVRLYNALSCFHEFSLQVPIVGFDGQSVAEYCNISTVAQPIHAMGDLAVDILIKLINGQIVPERSILPVTFIRRGSSSSSI